LDLEKEGGQLHAARKSSKTRKNVPWDRSSHSLAVHAALAKGDGRITIELDAGDKALLHHFAHSIVQDVAQSAMQCLQGDSVDSNVNAVGAMYDLIEPTLAWHLSDDITVRVGDSA
jgi:hypothetical protein